jgi:hypothetical protein
MRLPPLTATIQLRLLEADSTHFYPFVAGVEVSSVSTSLMLMWPRPKLFLQFWKGLLPRLHIDLRDKFVVVGVLGLAFGIEF